MPNGILVRNSSGVIPRELFGRIRGADGIEEVTYIPENDSTSDKSNGGGSE